MFTFAISEETPKPEVGLTANADVTHSVIVSGAFAFIIEIPEAL